MRLYANGGIAVFALLLLAAWWIARRSPDPIHQVAKAIWAGAGSLLAVVVNQPIGSIIARSRPYDTLNNVHILLDKTKDFSFPSDHATVSGAVAMGLLLANRRLGILAVGAALLMAFARVYAGAHYPGDVAAGLLLGAIVSFSFSGLATKVITAVLKKLTATPLRTLIVQTNSSAR